MRKTEPSTNPFTYGALALDDAFTDRERELKDLLADVENGQDVVLYAPRRFGKSSLVVRATQKAIRRNILVGYCDVMRTTTKERFAAGSGRGEGSRSRKTSRVQSLSPFAARSHARAGSGSTRQDGTNDSRERYGLIGAR